MESKKCITCNITKEISYFNKYKETYKNQCKECVKQREKKRIMENPIDTTITEKICMTCNMTKEINNFEKNGNVYRNDCKECRKMKRMATKLNNNTTTPNSPPDTHICSQCNKGPSEVKFQWRKDTGNWRNICYKCHVDKGYQKKYRENKMLNESIVT